MKTNRTAVVPESRRRPAGFTLVELLVVIGIIALLISILLPSLSKAREQANAVKCMSNLRSIGQGLFIYATTNKDSLPPGQYDGKVDGASVYNDGVAGDWTVQVTGALNPKYGTSYADAGPDVEVSRMRQIFKCPSVTVLPETPNSNTHYSCHPRLMPNLDDTDPITGTYYKPYKMGGIKRSSEIALVMDGTIIPDINNDGMNEWGANPKAIQLDAYRLF